MRDFFATWRDVVFSTDAFFAEPAAARSRWRPLGFALGVQALTSSAGGFLTALLGTRSLAAALALGAAFGVLGPLVTLIFVYPAAGIVHLFVRLIRGRELRFTDTFDCYCYCTAASLFGVVPVVGGLVAEAWSLFMMCLGLRRVHAMTTPQAGFAALAPLVSSVLLALMLRNYVVDAFRVAAGGMRPTLEVGDQLFVNKLAYRAAPPQRGDVVVFAAPPAADANEPDYVDRVVAVGGDTVEIKDDVVKVNGAPIPRRPVAGECRYRDYDAAAKKWQTIDCRRWDERVDGKTYTTYVDPQPTPRAFGPQTVPPEQLFVLGDNRDHASDSRAWGFVRRDRIKGRAWTIWWSEGPEAPRWSRVWQKVR